MEGKASDGKLDCDAPAAAAGVGRLDCDAPAAAAGDGKASEATAAAAARRRKGEALVIGFGGGGAEGHARGDLQGSFLKFKKERARALRVARESQARDRADPAARDRLRAAFVERVRSYVGVPYAQKYHAPGDEDYDAPLFLDCCALVRRAVDDLQAEFGFRLGRWNQAYQFDTLRHAQIPKEDMRAGDLVFYSGDYVSTKAKKQKHDMVHVEVWAGDGDKTIGARWHKGRVQVFPTYDFTPQSYTNVTHYFCSIEPWLRGECASHCDEHPWEIKGWGDGVGKHSLFAEQDEGASGDEDEPGESKEEAKDAES